MSEFIKILVTGATGFLGSHLVPVLQSSSDAEVTGVSRKDYDLMEPEQVKRMLSDTNPDAVIHLAAKVGGIIANAERPADYFYENLVMNTHVFHESYKAGVKKFLTCMGGCSYPADADSPITEDQMWNGYPQKESAPYSAAKKIILVQSEAYRKQHGFNSVVLVPGNMYGEYDNYEEQSSHVVPAFIRRFTEAIENGSKSITCYGSGRPTRDFVYAGDVAGVIPWFLDNYDSSDPVNISSGTRTSIRELAETVAEHTGYRGTIEWDTTKPDGQVDKIFSVQRLNDLGLSCETTLSEGLSRTIEWFKKSRSKGTVRL